MISRILAREFLAPSGVLRVGINLSNGLLISSKDPIKGVAASFAEILSTDLSKDSDPLDLQLIAYEHPHLICEAATSDCWDIALIGADPLRETHITFTRPYCEIPATFMVRKEDSAKFRSLSDLDKDYAKIMAKKDGAYSLWLRQNLKHATLLSQETLKESYEAFKSDISIDALAGLRSVMIEDMFKEPEYNRSDYTVLDTDFMSVQQAVAVRKKRVENDQVNAFMVAEYLNNVIDRFLRQKIIEDLIHLHKVNGKLLPSN